MNTKPYEYKELTDAPVEQNQPSPSGDQQADLHEMGTAGLQQVLGCGGQCPDCGCDKSAHLSASGQMAEAPQEPQEQPAEAPEGQAAPAQAPLTWLQCPACSCSVFKIAHHPDVPSGVKPRAFVCASCGGVLNLNYPDD